MGTLNKIKKEFKMRVVLPIVDSIKIKANLKGTNENLNNFNILAGLSSLNLHEILLSKNDTKDEAGDEVFESSLDISHEGDNNEIQRQTSFTLSRIDKFKTEIYKDIIYLLKLYEITNDKKHNKKHEYSHDNNVLSSYVRDVFSNIENISSVNYNKTDKIFHKIREDFSPKFAIEIYAAVLQILVKHELETSTSSDYQWSEKFCSEAETILTLYAEYQSLDEPYISYAKWIAYTEINQFKIINPDVFDKILHNLISKHKNPSKHKTAKKIKTKILKQFKNKSSSEKTKDLDIYTLRFPQNLAKEKVKNSNDACAITNQNDDIKAIFWECSRMLLKSIPGFVHKLHLTSENDNLDTNVDILEKTYLIIKRLIKIHPNQIEDIDFESQIKNSLTDGTVDYFIQNINHKILAQSDKNIERMDELINILKNAAEYINKFDGKFGSVFKSCYKISIPELLFHAYDSHLVNLIHPVISETCHLFEGKFNTHSNENEKCFSKVFELYHEIKKFVKESRDTYEIHNLKLLDNSQEWLLTGIETWRETSNMKVLIRIEKSIEVDKLKPEFDNSPYSSSAIDTMQILYSTKTFWENLELFDKRENLLKDITFDLCCSVIFYIEKFMDKIRNSSENRNNKMRNELTANIRLVSANQNYILENFKRLIKEFSNVAKSDEDEIQSQFKKTETSINDEISEYFALELRKFRPLIERAVYLNCLNENINDVAFNDIENILTSELSTTNFQEIKQMLWNIILEAIAEIIQKATNEKMMHEFFIKLFIFFTKINNLFNSIGNLPIDKDIIEKIKHMEYKLECYTQETNQLIHQYYKDRYIMQKDVSKSLLNISLTIFCCFVDDQLKIEILNARNLPVSELNKKCDSYVKVRMVPKQKFPTFKAFRTKVQHNTIFPLYDEKYQKLLTKEQQNLKDAIVCFSIREKCLVAGDPIIAEAFLSFEDIPKVTKNDKLKQTHLTLTKLQSVEIESLKAIHYRSEMGDVQAMDFLGKWGKLPRASLMMKQMFLNIKDQNIRKCSKY